MKTPYDLVSCILFAAVAVVWLQRSAAAERDGVAVWRYVVAALGCAVGDCVGNAGYVVAGWVLLVATAVFGVAALEVVKLKRRA